MASFLIAYAARETQPRIYTPPFATPRIAPSKMLPKGVSLRHKGSYRNGEQQGGCSMAGDRLIKVLEKCRKEYKAAPTRQEKSMLLDEFCRISGYHRKYANKLLSQPCCGGKAAVARPKRSTSYSTKSLEVIAYIWEKAGHPCSQRLKPMLPQWLRTINRSCSGKYHHCLLAQRSSEYLPNHS